MRFATMDPVEDRREPVEALLGANVGNHQNAQTATALFQGIAGRSCALRRSWNDAVREGAHPRGRERSTQRPGDRLPTAEVQGDWGVGIDEAGWPAIQCIMHACGDGDSERCERPGDSAVDQMQVDCIDSQKRKRRRGRSPREDDRTGRLGEGGTNRLVGARQKRNNSHTM